MSTKHYLRCNSITTNNSRRTYYSTIIVLVAISSSLSPIFTSAFTTTNPRYPPITGSTTLGGNGFSPAKPAWRYSSDQIENYISTPLNPVLPFHSSTSLSSFRSSWAGNKKARSTPDTANIFKPTTKTTSPTSILRKRLTRIYRRCLLPIMLTVFGMGSSLLVATKPAFAMAVGGGGGGVAKPMKREEIVASTCLFLTLFTTLALLHAVEISVTTLYPWKVREFAEEEEKSQKKNGIFKVLNEDITRVLTTILVTSTACGIYATTIFSRLASSIFGPRGETLATVVLTTITLFFVELLPKSIGVTNAEQVARLLVPPINLLSTIVSPLGLSLSWLSKKVLNLLGVNKDGSGGQGVSDSELRLIVMGARDSGTIDHSEGEMIKGVLNLQSQRVKEIMRPRVDMVAVPKDTSIASVLNVVRESGYSRIPVYDGEIDNIVGIVLAKNVLDFFVKGVMVDKPLSGGSSNGSGTREKEDSVVSYSLRLASGEASQGYVKALTGAELASRMERTVSDANLIEECYFVPDTANGWAVLEEMRKRRIHMAIVVDEYGGTEGLVSLEDIVEEVVGEIYDEDDEDDFEFTEDSIKLQEDGTFIARGDADLEDCDLILGLSLDEEETLKEFGTLSGFLCMCAGEIPKVGDFILSRGWSFEIVDADPKKILTIRVERLVGCFDNEEEEDKAVLGFLKKSDKNSMKDVQDAKFDVDMNMEGKTNESSIERNGKENHSTMPTEQISDGDAVTDGKKSALSDRVLSSNAE